MFLPNVGVIGAGGWGKNHLRVFSEIGALTAFCDIDRDKVKYYGEKFRVKGYTSPDKLLRAENLDGVTICTPTSTHYELAKKSIGCGIHTLVEKPLTRTSKEGMELVALAEKNGVKLSVGFIERFNPAVEELKKLLMSRKIGTPLLLEFHREHRWTGSVTDVGIITDTSVHDIDTARWLFGEEPISVYARTGRVMSGHEDFAAIILGFNEQRTAFIASNWVTPKRIRQLTAVCTGGVVSVDFISQETRVDDGRGTTIPRRPYEEPLMRELRSFVECVSKNRQPLVTGMDGVKVTRIAEAALDSSRRGVPIKLKL